MTIEPFHDYDRHFLPSMLILFHDNKRPHKLYVTVFLPMVLQILQDYASHCAVYCNRGINVNSILSVEKVRRFVCKHLRPM